MGNFKKVFTPEQEQKIVDYIKEHDVLTFEIAENSELKYPFFTASAAKLEKTG